MTELILWIVGHLSGFLRLPCGIEASTVNRFAVNQALPQVCFASNAQNDTIR